MRKEYLRVIALVAVTIASSAVTAVFVSSHTVQAGMSQNGESKVGILFSGLPAGPSGTITPPFLKAGQLLTRGQDNDKVEIATLLYTYGFFHDSGNSAGIASLFTKDGAIEGLGNDNGVLLHGRGCLSQGDQVGRVAVDAAGDTAKPGEKQVARPFPGHSHNIMTNVIVQVNGETASLHAYYTRVLANVEGNPPVAIAPNTATVSHTGEYVSDVRRTPDGWRFYRHRIIGDVSANPNPGVKKPCS